MFRHVLLSLLLKEVCRAMKKWRTLTEQIEVWTALSAGRTPGRGEVHDHNLIRSDYESVPFFDTLDVFHF